MAFCTACGANIPEDVKFCTACGNTVQPVSAMATAQRPGAVVSKPSPIPPPMPQAATRPIYPSQAAPPPTYAPQHTPASPVYTPQITSAPTAYAPPAGADDAPPVPGSRYAVMGTGAYIGFMLLFCIPAIGWLACILMSFTAKNKNRRNFSRAMLVFVIIGAALSVTLYFVSGWVSEAIVLYVNETAGSLTG